jgi:hypothetical protein
MSLDPSHAVEVSLKTVREPSPTQQAAWAALWRRLLAPTNESPAPAEPAGTGLACAREPDAPMDHDREVTNDPIR